MLYNILYFHILYFTKILLVLLVVLLLCNILYIYEEYLLNYFCFLKNSNVKLFYLYRGTILIIEHLFCQLDILDQV